MVYHLDEPNKPNGEIMASVANDRVPHGRGRPRLRTSAAADLLGFWALTPKKRGGPTGSLHVFLNLVERVVESPGIDLYNAVEAGVPTDLVNVIAGATGESAADVMEMVACRQPHSGARRSSMSPCEMWRAIASWASCG